MGHPLTGKPSYGFAKLHLAQSKQNYTKGFGPRDPKEL
jgi:hypothetical protein